MKGFFQKISFHTTCERTFLMHLISRIPPYPHRVHQASSPLADPPLPSNSDVIYLRFLNRLIMELKIISYNSTGFNVEKSLFTNFLCNSLNSHIIFLQEHMHLKANLYRIKKEFPLFNSSLLPATKKNDMVSSGRPSGGLGIFWKKCLNNNVKIIKHPHSNRAQGIMLFQKYVLINVYFPTDPNVQIFDEFDLLKCLEDISWYFNEFPNMKIIVGGI